MKAHVYPLLPKPLARALGHLPRFPGSLLFAAGLSRVLGPQLPGDVRAALEGRSISIGVTDAGVRFDVSWRGSRFVALSGSGKADLSIGASARDFLLLAQRREDPDTLFFSRRLTMEGDTELGLLVKNTIDAIDVALFDPERLLPARWRRAASN
ncbi:ubiquinone anaerobic biosynthesis accessory factor UbiT [Massilia scottii]|uniref:ubiquinone anaerobic biosynthesis accessory factor UbiT n=1 Tax=Massilia scottii TaxID=3057166 RepID=UPI002796CC17|nr:SCP2 sterol-binding domain-containing protein [Massilia sp. CCM 9029]MDQ1829377.1 SCP2 sterol-binding domain-containing protein [Massilia sp. CCM 9029]